MSKTDEEIDEMKGMMTVARRRELNFGFCLGRTYESALLIMHRWRSTEVLGREARKQGETVKIVTGKLRLKSRTLTLNCNGLVPSNTARQMRFLMREYELLLKIEITEGDETIQSDGEDDGKDTENAKPLPSGSPKHARQWVSVLPVFDAAVARTVAADGPKADIVQSAWDGAKFAASEGRFEAAMKVAKKIKPMLVANE